MRRTKVNKLYEGPKPSEPESSLTIYFPGSITPEEFEFWVGMRHCELADLGATLEPDELIDYLVNEERSLSV